MYQTRRSTTKGESHGRGGCERPRCPGEQSQRVAADRPKREDQLVNEGGNAPRWDRVPVTEDLAPSEDDFC